MKRISKYFLCLFAVVLTAGCACLLYTSMYYGHLLEALKKYDEAVGQYEKAIQLDPTKTDLYKNISSAYEQKNEDVYKRQGWG